MNYILLNIVCFDCVFFSENDCQSARLLTEGIVFLVSFCNYVFIFYLPYIMYLS